MAIVKNFVLLFLFYQSFIEEKNYVNTMVNDILIRIDTKDLHNLNEVMQNYRNWRIHNQKEERELTEKSLNLSSIIEKNTVAHAKLELDKQLVAIRLVAFSGIVDHFNTVVNYFAFVKGGFKLVYPYEYGVIKQLTNVLRELSDISNEMIARRNDFIDNIKTDSNQNAKLHHVNKHGNLDLKIGAEFIDFFMEQGVFQKKLKDMKQGELREFIRSFSAHARNNSALQLNDSKLSPIDFLRQSNLNDKDETTNYLKATSKVLKKHMEITQICYKINFERDTSLLVPYALLLIVFCLIKATKKYMRYRCTNEKDIFKKMDKKRRKEENNRPWNGNAKGVTITTINAIQEIEHKNTEEYSTIIDWLDLIPDIRELFINMQRMNKYSNQIGEFKYEKPYANVITKEDFTADPTNENLVFDKQVEEIIEDSMAKERDNLDRRLQELERKEDLMAQEKKNLDKKVKERVEALMAQEKKNLDNKFLQKQIEFLEKQMDSIESRLECPVCLETASSPIYQCQESHLICRKCRPKVRTCPQCRLPYTGKPQRNRYAENDSCRLKKLNEEKLDLGKP